MGIIDGIVIEPSCKFKRYNQYRKIFEMFGKIADIAEEMLLNLRPTEKSKNMIKE